MAPAYWLPGNGDMTFLPEAGDGDDDSDGDDDGGDDGDDSDSSRLCVRWWSEVKENDWKKHILRLRFQEALRKK